MGKLFNLQNNVLVVEPEQLNIPEFREIWDRDTHKLKIHAWRELSYIYYTTDYQSPYCDLDDKEEQVKHDFIKDKAWKPDKAILDAIVKYELLQETSSLKLLKGSLTAANKLNKFFNNFNFDERDDRGKPVYTVTEVTGALKNIGGVVDSINKLTEQVKKERSLNTKVRGGGSVGRREN